MIFFILFVLFIVFLYFYNVRTFNYWKVRGIKYEEPVLFFGTYRNMYLRQQSRSQIIEEVYWKYPNEKLVGIFKSTAPELVLRDPELVKKVMVTDFATFFYRGLNVLKDESEPLRKHLFAIEGDQWRMLRQRMTPAFTSGKLKAMFPLIIERTEKLQSRALAAASTNAVLDARDLIARYTTDFIGACGFGIDADTLNEENSAFRQLGRKMFTTPLSVSIIHLLKDVFPEYTRSLKIFERVESDIFSLLRQIMKQRNYKPSGRNDFIDLMLEYYNKPMRAESIEKVNADGSPIMVEAILDDALFAAQVFVFFGAGFETSSSSSSYALFELAHNQDVQKKVQQNIDEVLARYENKLCYEAVKEMTYLEWAFKEALRKFPSLGYLTRKSAKKYTFDEIGLTIDEDVTVCIPVQGLHMDPLYWDSPEEFRPERFHPDNFTAIQKIVYLPFGEGPRNCIGSRLGLMQSMAGLAAILSKFTVEPAPTTKRKLDVEPTSNVVQGVRGGIPLLFKVRKDVAA